MAQFRLHVLFDGSDHNAIGLPLIVHVSNPTVPDEFIGHRQPELIPNARLRGLIGKRSNRDGFDMGGDDDGRWDIF